MFNQNLKVGKCLVGSRENMQLKMNSEFFLKGNDYFIQPGDQLLR